jgi:hypothetical protein
MGYFNVYGREGSTYVNTFSSSGEYYDSNAGTQTVLFRIPNTSNSFFLDLDTEVTSVFIANDTNSPFSYSFISGGKAYSQTGPFLEPYSTPLTAFGSFTIVPAGYTGKVDGLSSGTSTVLGISTASESFGYYVPPDFTATASSSRYVEPTRAFPYQGGAQVYTCTTEGTYFAVPNSTNGFDYFNSFGVNGLLVESTTSEVRMGTGTSLVPYTSYYADSTTFYTTPASFNGLSYITSQVTTPLSERFDTNGFVFGNHVIAPATQIPQGIDFSAVRRNDMDAREIFGFGPNIEYYYSTFMDAPLLGQNIPVLIPHERTSYGYFSTYPIYTVPFGEYALNSNSMTFYSPTTTIGSGSDSSNTYSTQNSASYIINSNACNSSTYSTFISTDRGITTGTLEISFGGFLGVTSYTTGLSPASSSTSYALSTQTNTALRWEFFIVGSDLLAPFVVGTYSSWEGDYVFGDRAFGDDNAYGYANFRTSKFPVTSQITIGTPNSNAYVVWGTQGFIAELNGVLGAF